MMVQLFIFLCGMIAGAALLTLIACLATSGRGSDAERRA